MTSIAGSSFVEHEKIINEINAAAITVLGIYLKLFLKRLKLLEKINYVEEKDD